METLFFLHGVFSVSNKLIILENCTEDDYWILSNEDVKVEFAKGRIYIHSPASINHELIFQFLIRLINHHLELNNQGVMLGSRVAIRLPNGHRPEPDLLYLEAGSYDPLATSIFEGTPRWIIEIISPSTRKHDTGEKLLWYEEAKIEEVWIVDPENRQLVVHKYDSKANAFKSSTTQNPIKPIGFDFEINPSWLWELPRLSEVLD